MTFKRVRAALAATGLASFCLAPMAQPASAFDFNDHGLTLVWVTIKAYPGEGLWQACRRVYQRDVYIVQRSRSGDVRCKIEHHRLYDYGERRQNFNLGN